MCIQCQPPDPGRPGTLVTVRTSICDYEVVAAWGGSSRRYRCRPPGRLGRSGEVLVTELVVDADGWPQLRDQLLRMVTAPGGRMLEVIEAGPDPEAGGAFVAAEMPTGGSLATAGRGSGTPDRTGRLEAVVTAARGMHALHEVGLAHGSVHAGSVLLTGGAAVLDLPRLDAPAGEVLPVDGWAALEAVDPELLRGECPGRASDIWALGATLHSVVSDRPLFEGIDGDEPVTAVQRVMFTRPVPDPALPSALRRLISDCVAADPVDRPGTALAVAERLEETEA